MDEYVLRPTELAGHKDVELPFQRILTSLKNDQIVAPADLCNQWLHSFVVPVEQVKFSHVEDIAPGKSADPWELGPQVIGKLFRDGRTMLRINLPLHDHSPNVPVQADKFLVDRFKGFVLGGANTLLDLGQQAQVVPWFAEAVFWSFVSRFHPYSLRHPSRHRWDDHQLTTGLDLRKSFIYQEKGGMEGYFHCLGHPFHTQNGGFKQ